MQLYVRQIDLKTYEWKSPLLGTILSELRDHAYKFQIQKRGPHAGKCRRICPHLLFQRIE